MSHTGTGAVSIQAKDLPEPILTPIAEEILARRYLIKDEEGNPTETARDMFWRVATHVAQAERVYGAGNKEVEAIAKEFYIMMAGGYWLPNSPTLMNAGRPLGQLSACFVLPVADSLSNGKDGIYDTLKDMALIHQSGGGTGFSFSGIRPNGSIVKSTTGVASGPVSFMSLYDSSTEVVKQGGTRRGANMGILRVNHPDIREFLHCKQDTSKITNFNISVAITNDFMEKVKSDSDYDLVDPTTGKAVDSQPARGIWGLICECAWRTGEPGLFFIDEANYHNPVPHMGSYEATNPCAEQPLLSYDVCNLGSLNLGRFVKDKVRIGTDDIDFDEHIDWDGIEAATHTSIRFLDNVIDVNKYPLDEIKRMSKRIRRIGNGVMGWADMLIKLGIPYDSNKAIALADMMGLFFKNCCTDASEGLAEKRGVFPAWKVSVHGPHESCAVDEVGERIRLNRLQRNCNVTTIAPTGTISMIAGCSGGIEPLYDVVFTRKQAGMDVVDINPDFKEDLESMFSNADSILEDVSSGGEIPFELGWLYKTSATVEPVDHVMMQAAWQRHICSGISKTINLPKKATVEDVNKAFSLAHKLNCKGVTVYRDGSRLEQVLSTVKTNDRPREEGSSQQDGSEHRPDSREYKRPTSLSGCTSRIDSPIGGMYVTVNRDEEERPYEVFIHVGKAGGTTGSFSEALGRLISLCFRHGISVDKVHKQLRGISSDKAFGLGNGKVASGPDAVAKVLEEYLGQETAPHDAVENDFGVCVECGTELIFQEGCFVCPSCGYEGCG